MFFPSGSADEVISILLTAKDEITPVTKDVEASLKSMKTTSEATSEKVMKSNLNITDSFQSLGLGTAIGLGSATAALGLFIKTGIEEARDAEINARRIEFAYKDMSKTVMETSENLAVGTGIADDDISKAFLSSKLAVESLGLGFKEQSFIIKAAMDFAASGVGDFESNVDKLVNGLRGNERAVHDFGISFKGIREGSEGLPERLDVTREAAERVADAAKKNADQWAVFKENLRDAAKEMGGPFLQGLNGLLEPLNKLFALKTPEEFNPIKKSETLFGQDQMNQMVTNDMRDQLGLPRLVDATKEVSESTSELQKEYVLQKEKVQQLKNTLDPTSQSFAYQIKVLQDHQKDLDLLTAKLGGNESANVKLADSVTLAKNRIFEIDGAFGQLIRTLGGNPPGVKGPNKVYNLDLGLPSSQIGGVRSLATGQVSQDFISRPGAPVQNFSPNDTIIGVKDPSKLMGGGINITINAPHMDGRAIAEEIGRLVKVGFNYS